MKVDAFYRQTTATWYFCRIEPPYVKPSCFQQGALCAEASYAEDRQFSKAGVGPEPESEPFLELAAHLALYEWVCP